MKKEDYRNSGYKVERDANGLLEHLCGQMELVASRGITLDEAKEQANLVKQANNVLRYQLDVKKFDTRKQSSTTPR